MLEANKKQVPLKSYSLEIRIGSVNQILKNKEKVTKTCSINILTRITDRKIQYVYIHVYQILKNWGPGPYNSLRHADNRKYFSGLSLTQKRREVQMAKEEGKIWTCSCWETGNFIMINEFRYGQTWRIWPYLLSLPLYSTFKSSSNSIRYNCQKICSWPKRPKTILKIRKKARFL